MQMRETYKSAVNPEADSDEEIQAGSKSGVYAILSNSTFASKASSIYLKQVRSYLDIDHPAPISSLLNQNDPNLFYSLNISALWLLLKDKIQKLGSVYMFEHSCDKIAIKFSMVFASVLCLNDAKEKVMEKDKQTLRKNIKEYLLKKTKHQQNRKASILQQFNKSEFFKEVSQKIKASGKNIDNLKSDLIHFTLKKNPSVISFLQKVLSYLQRTIQQKQNEIRNKSVSSSIFLIESITRQAYCVLLLCTYLNIYLILADWIKVLLKDKSKKMEKLLFNHLTERKGFHVINRVLDDAPLNVLAEEITQLQEIYYR